MSQTILSDDFESLKQSILEGWVKNIHVIADFDRTLTKNFVNGVERPSLISVLRSENILWEEYAKKAYNLYNTYNPIEIDPNIALEEKKKQMTIWWWKHLDLLIESWLNKTHIQETVDHGIIHLRDGVPEFLEFLHTHHIPLIIMSANGLGWDSIRMYLESQQLMFDNIHIISNTLIWSDDGIAIWRAEPLIHTFNKDETVLQAFPDIYIEIASRKNVLLLGDSLEDTGMSDGFEYDNIIKIGFLNKKISESLLAYRASYNVVLTDDTDFSFINELICPIV